MMKMYIKLIAILFVFPLLTGCWDQKLIIDSEVINGISFDLKDNKIKSTIVVLQIIPKGSGYFDFNNQQSSATGDSIDDTFTELRMYHRGPLSASKSRIILLGESFAKKNLNSYLDLFYRNPDPYLGSKVAIVKGLKASELFSFKEIGTDPIAFGLYEIIDAAEENSTIPEGNLNTLFSLFNEAGKDFILPVLEQRGDGILVSGAGLISQNAFSGKMIQLRDCSLLLLLMNNYEKKVDLLTYMSEEKKLNNQVSYRITKAKRKINIQKDASHKPVVNLKLDLSVGLKQYPKTSNITPKQLKKLQTTISNDLTKRANHIMKTTQKANSDVLGIGQRIKETDPGTWQSLDWKETYPSIKINTHVKVEIVKTGIIK